MGKAQLIVHLDRFSVRFLRVVDQNPEKEYSFVFNDKTDAGYKDQLGFFLDKTEFRGLAWDEYSLSWYSEHSTLLPFSVFDASTPKAVFELSFGKKENPSAIDYNRLPENTLVNIFALPEWVKGFFVARFPRIVVQHEGSHAIRGLLAEQSYRLKIMLVLHKEHFMLLATQNSQLAYYNQFQWQSTEDLIYHSAHMIERCTWKGVEGDFYFVAEGENRENATAAFLRMAQKIDLFRHLQVAEKSHLLTQFQALCV